MTSAIRPIEGRLTTFRVVQFSVCGVMRTSTSREISCLCDIFTLSIHYSFIVVPLGLVSTWSSRRPTLRRPAQS